MSAPTTPVASVFLTKHDVARYGREKGCEDYEYRHQTPIPGLERPRLRPYIKTPIHSRLASRGAVFTQIYGWERPKWYPTVAGLPQSDVVDFRHTDWFAVVAEECVAVRERVGVFDSTAFAKFEPDRTGCARCLIGLAPTLCRGVGRIALTYLLTPTGRIEGEATVSRLAEDHFYLVSAAVGEQKDREYFETHWPRGARPS